MANNREILKRMKRGKYGNLKFNGFDSKKEAQFAADLERLKAAMAIGCDDSEFCPIEIDRRPSETKVGAVLVEVS